MRDDGPRPADFVSVDCAGRSLESVVAAVVRAVVGADPGVPVRLERVEDAGPLVSSRERDRITYWARTAASQRVRRPVTVAPSTDAADWHQGVVRHELPAAPEELLWLAAAAALELPWSSVEVWQEFAAALAERPLSVEQLSEFAATRPELRVIGRSVGFADRATHRDVRARLPLTDAQHRAVHRALVGLRADPGSAAEGAADYVHAAWPVHAALAGELEHQIEDPDFLVESGWYGIALGLALAYPDGVPLGGIAGDLHCVLLEGLAEPASHEEWLSWVHHTLVGRGAGAAAAAVASRVRLPWQTLWSHWQWPSGYAPRSREEIEQDELCLVQGPDGPAVATRRESSDDADTVFEQLWDIRTGERLGAPGTTAHDEVEIRAEGAPVLPWTGDSVRDARQCTPADPDEDGAVWAFMGRCGLFGALVRGKTVAELPEVARGWYGHTVAPRAQWPVPDVSLTGTLTRAELEQDWAYGAGACRPVAPEVLPAALTDRHSRELLTEVGWPVTEHWGLSTVELVAGGLRTADGHPDLLVGLGTFLGSPLLLDGRSGAVFRAREDGLALMTTGLAQMLRIDLLHRAVLSVPVLLGAYDAGNLEEDLGGWIRTVDAAAAEGGFWEHAYFAQSLIEVWEESVV